VLDLGCSYGNLLRRLLEEKQFEEIVGYDVSHRALEVAASDCASIVCRKSSASASA